MTCATSTSGKIIGPLYNLLGRKFIHQIIINTSVASVFIIPMIKLKRIDFQDLLQRFSKVNVFWIAKGENVTL